MSNIKCYAIVYPVAGNPDNRDIRIIKSPFQSLRKSGQGEFISLL